MRIFQLPFNTTNCQIVDSIPDINQTVAITIKTLFFNVNPANPASQKITQTVADVILNGTPILLSQPCANGNNINNFSHKLARYYFLWNNATLYPIYKNFGIININNESQTYSENDRNRNVVLISTAVNLWDYYNEISNANRQIFYDLIGYKAN